MKTKILSIAFVVVTIAALGQEFQEPVGRPQIPVPSTSSTNPPSPPVISGPVWTALTWGSGASTNWAFVPYGIWSSSGDKYGAGLAGLFKLNDFVVPMLRLDYYDSRVWMPSASVNLQAPLTLFGKFTAVPFVFTGLATPLSGKGNDNNTAVGIAGAGVAIRLTKYLDIAYDLEKWSGFDELQNRVGLVIKLGNW